MNTVKMEQESQELPKAEYITMSQLAELTGVSKKTLIKNRQKIPGIVRFGNEYMAIYGTRYPFKFLKHHYIGDSRARRYVLLKAISQYSYISAKDLRLTQQQFNAMLQDFENAGYIRKNGHDNQFGANGYDCTEAGDMLLQRINEQTTNKKAEMRAKLLAVFLEETLKSLGKGLTPIEI